MSSQPAAVLHSVLADFPPVQHAFAYGSGVFEQPGLYDAPEQAAGAGAAVGGAAASRSDRPMLDFIFAVDDPAAWHEEVCRWTKASFSRAPALVCRATAAITARLCRLLAVLPCYPAPTACLASPPSHPVPRRTCAGTHTTTPF